MVIFTIESKMTEATREEHQTLEKLQRETIANLLKLTARDRILYTNAAFTELSRYVFHQCLTEKNQEKAQRQLRTMKNCYLGLTRDTRLLLLQQKAPSPNESSIFPRYALMGFFNSIHEITPEEDFLTFLNFLNTPQNEISEMENILPFQGILAFFLIYHSEDEKTSAIKFFRDKTVEGINQVEKLHREKVLTHFFGNVSNGNFDTALLVNTCYVREVKTVDEFLNYFRLYQFSRRAGLMFGEDYGRFGILKSELDGVDRHAGICLVDGFCAHGGSIKESITGFRNEGFVGSIYVFIGHGCFPNTDNKFFFEQLYPNPRKEPLHPGKFADSCILLKLKN